MLKFAVLLDFVCLFFVIYSIRTEYEKQVRAQKIRQEMSQAKREHDFYAEKHSLASTITNIEERKVWLAMEMMIAVTVQ